MKALPTDEELAAAREALRAELEAPFPAPEAVSRSARRLLALLVRRFPAREPGGWEEWGARVRERALERFSEPEATIEGGRSTLAKAETLAAAGARRTAIRER